MNWRISERSEKACKHWGSWSLFAISTLWCTWWLRHTPSIGYAIGALAVVASVMAALMESLKALARFAWIILLFGFLRVEMNAIDEDKRKTTKELTAHFASISDQAQTNLKNTLNDENKNFGAILGSQEKNFSATMDQMLRQQQEQNREFSAILAKQQQLFERQQEFTEFLTGKLLPASDPMPSTSCAPNLLRPGDVLLLLGKSTFIADTFPHTILRVSNRNVLSIDRTTSGSFTLSVDVRGADNVEVFRLDRDGFRAASGVHMLRPDKSTILFEDAYGKELMRARFLNPSAFSLSGSLDNLNFTGRRWPIVLSPNLCLVHRGLGVDVVIQQ
jgi:hypothetical protein